MYHGNRKLLPHNSRILSFAKQFDILAEAKHPHEAINRIYGKHYRHKAAYPKNTSLQRNALEHFKFLGESCGIRYLDKQP